MYSVYLFLYIYRIYAVEIYHITSNNAICEMDLLLLTNLNEIVKYLM